MLSEIKQIKYYAKGKRSNVYIGYLDRTKVIIKKQNQKIASRYVIKNEAKWLKIVNECNIGPKLISEGKDYLIMEFIQGKKIMNFLEEAERQDILKVIVSILEKCKTLDSLKIIKQEMHKPLKHIIINKNNPRLIDFERCKFSEKPKNLTQFCQFLTSKKVSEILKNKNIIIDKKQLRKFLSIYKKT